MEKSDETKEDSTSYHYDGLEKALKYQYVPLQYTGENDGNRHIDDSVDENACSYSAEPAAFSLGGGQSADNHQPDEQADKKSDKHADDYYRGKEKQGYVSN